MRSITGTDFSHITKETHDFWAEAFNDDIKAPIHPKGLDDIGADNFDEYICKIAAHMDALELTNREFKYWGGTMSGDDLSFDLFGKVNDFWIKVTVHAVHKA